MQRSHVLIAVIAAGFALVFYWRHDPSSAASTESRVARADGPPRPKLSRDPLSPSVGNEVQASPIMSAPEIARVVEGNSRSGRMIFIDLAVSADGVTALRATGAAGRAKARPMRVGAGQLLYEVYSSAGERTASGSVEDPLHQRFEYEDERQPGKWRMTMVNRSEGRLNLRLPGEANAARIVFFRTRVAANEVGRVQAGEVILR